ncbi:MAG: hypothetical protein V2J26_03480 [Pacificimonas sp.]|jgi:tetratricopeptide (TPR) repeat protein|nr:hypothetical protein [Pacificimonas sp.]
MTIRAMTARRLPALLGGLLALETVSAGQPAQAGVSVFGSSSAVLCYQTAETGKGYVEGIRECDRALDEALSRPHRAATHVNRGIIQMHMARYGRALADYDRALAIDGELGEAFVNRGIAKWHAGLDMTSALADLDRGIALGTTDEEIAHFIRALVHEELGNVSAAYFDLRRAAELNPAWEAPRVELQRFQVQG